MYRQWFWHILPYLEQPRLAGKMTSPISACPSDPRHSLNYDNSQGLGIWGLGWYVALDAYGIHDNLGMIDDWYFGFRLTDVTDGLSNTLMAVERIPSPDLYWGWWGYPTGKDTRTPARDRWPFYEFSNSPPPHACPVPAITMPGSVRDQCAFNAPGGFHPGGFQGVLGDGSVRFITFSGANAIPSGRPSSESILVWLATRAGGEVVPDY